MKKLWKILSNPWMIALLLAIGWLPLFIADDVWMARPDLDRDYVPQAFAMEWMMITVLSSLLAIGLSLVHIVLLIIRRSARNTPSGLGL